MSRSPTTADKRVGYADSRPASGYATYQSKEQTKGSRRGDQPERSIAGTGPNPNGTGAVMRQVANYETGRFEDSNGFAQMDNELQCLDCPQPLARHIGS